MIEEAVEPILDAVNLGRTDILKTLLEEVKASLAKQAENDSATGKFCSLSTWNVSFIEILHWMKFCVHLIIA